MRTANNTFKWLSQCQAGKLLGVPGFKIRHWMKLGYIKGYRKDEYRYLVYNVDELKKLNVKEILKNHSRPGRKKKITAKTANNPSGDINSLLTSANDHLKHSVILQMAATEAVDKAANALIEIIDLLWEKNDKDDKGNC